MLHSSAALRAHAGGGRFKCTTKGRFCVPKSHDALKSSRIPQRGPYSQAVRQGDLIFVAGQAGLDPATGQVVGGTFELQARQAFENLRILLEDVGSGLDQVVKTTCFLAVPEAFDTLNALYAEYFPTAAPARSTPVVQLPRGLLFSIEAVAVAASKSSTA
jgi:2-iminobutanoate/2-iminopropanoate deaminase